MEQGQGPKVSIIMPVYNHEPFIRQALESVLMQRTDFDYELLVGDDASQDGSQAIIREMEPLFQGKMKPVLRGKNLGALANGKDLLERARGKYLAFLEGDDYWLDPLKLQKQADFLDTHPDYAACYHKNRVVDAENRVLYEIMHEFTFTGDFTLEHYNRFRLPGQTATIMLRRSILETLPMEKLPLIRHTPGDRLVPLAALSYGKIFCSDEIMSAYRTVVHSGRKSWSTKFGLDDLPGNWYFFNMCLEMDKIGEILGLPVSQKEQRQRIMMGALRKLRGKKVQYIPLICWMEAKETDRRGLHEQVWKPYWRETREKLREKLNGKKAT